MNKNSFILYNSYLEQAELLSMEQRGELFTAILNYANGLEVQELDAATMMAFSFIKKQMDADTEKYEETCNKRKEAGKLGGRPAKANGLSEKAKKANGFSENQTKAKKPDNEYEYDNEYDSKEKQEKEKFKEQAEQIVGYLNHKCGTNYRSSSANTKKLIHARLADGYTFDDFKTVIDKKCADWSGGEMEKYLRPDTLFGTKFEGYLNQKSPPKQQNKTTSFNTFEHREYNFGDLNKQLFGGDNDADTA